MLPNNAWTVPMEISCEPWNMPSTGTTPWSLKEDRSVSSEKEMSAFHVISEIWISATKYSFYIFLKNMICIRVCRLRMLSDIKLCFKYPSAGTHWVRWRWASYHLRLMFESHDGNSLKNSISWSCITVNMQGLFPISWNQTGQSAMIWHIPQFISHNSNRRQPCQKVQLLNLK